MVAITSARSVVGAFASYHRITALPALTAYGNAAALVRPIQACGAVRATDIHRLQLGVWREGLCVR